MSSFEILERKAVIFAVKTRVFYIGLQFVSNLLIKDLSGRHHLIRPPEEEAEPGSLLSGLTRFDGLFFLDIARSGYEATSQPHLAFFPLYPAAVRAIAVLTWLPLEFSAIILSALSAVVSAILIFRLTAIILGDPVLAYKSSLLMSLSPISIFAAAAYTESFYSMLVLGALLALTQDKDTIATSFLFLASATRSNGTMNVVFVLGHYLRKAVNETAAAMEAAASTDQNGNSIKEMESKALLSKGLRGGIFLARLLRWAPRAAIGGLACAAPFALFQAFAYNRFCTFPKDIVETANCSLSASSSSSPWLTVTQFDIDRRGAENESSLSSSGCCTDDGSYPRLLLPSPMSMQDLRPPWCSDSVPMAYSYVQSKYWGVGPFKYWSWANFPAFLMAAPILVFLCWQSLNYLALTSRREEMRRLMQTATPSTVNNAADARPGDTKRRPGARLPHHDRGFRDPSSSARWRRPLEPPPAVPPPPPPPAEFFLHQAALAAFAVANINIHVVTRLLLSSSPLMYWLFASVTSPTKWSARHRERAAAETGSLAFLWADSTQRAMECMGKRLTERSDKQQTEWRSLFPPLIWDAGAAVEAYILCYLLLGFTLFPNNFPWT